MFLIEIFKYVGIDLSGNIGLLTSIELPFASKSGYKITVIKGHPFSTSEFLFKSFVEDLSKFKNELTGSKRQVIKSLLNKLFGKFFLNFEKLTRSIIIYEPKKIIKYNRPLNIKILTRSITIYEKKNIIKYIKPLNSYIVTRYFSVYVINKKPKLILDLCNANYKKFNDCHGLDNADVNEDNIKNIDIKYFNSWLLFFLLLSTVAPLLVYITTGVNIIDHCSTNEARYSNSFLSIRKICATLFVFSIKYLCFFNIDMGRLKRSIFKQPFPLL
jgi:hypothetical protein